MLKIEQQLTEKSGQAYEYSSTLKVLPLDDAIHLSKAYAVMLLENYINSLADQTMICDNNHHKTITEEEIRNFKIDLI
jgi:hypothetical protein